MTTAETMPKNASNINMLYSRLRARYCPDGDVTLGERMMQASTRMKTVSTSSFSENDTAACDASYTATAARPTDRNILLRNFCAILLSCAVLVCLAYSFFRMIGSKNNGEVSENASYAVTAIDERKAENYKLNADADSDVAAIGASYDAFRTAFEK